MTLGVIRYRQSCEISGRPFCAASSTERQLTNNSSLLRYKVYEPILTVGAEKLAELDIRLRVKGGGHVSQIYALRQAIAKGIVA